MIMNIEIILEDEVIIEGLRIIKDSTKR